jgi:integrase
MSVYRPRGTDRYVYEFQIARVKYRGPCNTENLAEAKRVERKARTDAEAGVKPDAASEMTIDVACDRWFEEVGQHQPSFKNWLRSLKLIEECVGSHVKLKEITTATVAEAVRRRKLMHTEFRNKKGHITASRPPKASTVNRQVVDLMKRIMRRAEIVWGAKNLHRIDWSAIRMTEPPPREREVSDDEHAKLDAELKPHWRPFRAFLATYGLRLGEMFFAPSDVYDIGGQVRVRIRDRKDGSTYTIDLLPDDGRLMLARKSRAQAAGLATVWFKEWRGKLWAKDYQAARTAIRRAVKRAGLIDFTIHDHRHDVATRLTREAGIAVAQSQLGHSDIGTTRRYVKVSTKDRLDALSRIKTGGKVGETPEDELKPATNQGDGV